MLPLLDELLRTRCLGNIYLVDNSPESARRTFAQARIRYVHTGKNLGYGAAHNIAIRESIAGGTAFHLVMNSDIIVRAEDIDALYAFMEAHDEVGQLMPHVTYPDGRTQYLCKLLPTPMDVFGRRLLPGWMNARRNARYELRHTGYDHPMNVPYLSGCFMFLRTEALARVDMFDERYFMYPEDIDLTRRIHRDYVTLYYPDVTIVHNHAQGSYHNLRLLWIHIVNMCRYFNKWGWICDAERSRINRQTLSTY